MTLSRHERSAVTTKVFEKTFFNTKVPSRNLRFHVLSGELAVFPRVLRAGLARWVRLTARGRRVDGVVDGAACWMTALRLQVRDCCRLLGSATRLRVDGTDGVALCITPHSARALRRDLSYRR